MGRLCDISAALCITGIGALAIWRAARASSGRLGDFDGRRESLSAMPRRWWRKQAPASDKLCYRSKVDALLAFADWNRDVIENYGGMGYEVSPQEFDAINWKYDLRTPGKRRVKSIAEALWVAMPPGKPFCLDRIDLDALNDSSPGREHDVGFQVPDYVLESRDQDWSWYRERELEPVPF